MTILGGITKQLDIFCCITGFTSDFLSFVVVELIRFFHGALRLFVLLSDDRFCVLLNILIFIYLQNGKLICTGDDELKVTYIT